MKTVKAEIVHHFIEEHNRLLGGASLLAGNIHPNDIVQIGDVRLNPSGSDESSLDFSVNFQVGRVNVFYFGTITDEWNIVNEAVAGRNAAGTIKPDL